MSNQVYRDKQNDIPYDGEQAQYNISLTGNSGGTGFIGVHLTRVCPGTIKLSVVSTQVGINWNNSTVLTSNVGAIPLGFRPATEVYQYIPLLRPTSPVQPQLAMLIMTGAGTFTINAVTSDGTLVNIAASTTLGLFDIFWLNNEIAP